MAKITRRLEFDAGHRVLRHESKCANLHGHRYRVHITVHAKDLDEVGRVIDFSVIKDKIGGWIDAHWDHNVLLHPEDPLTNVRGALGPREPYIMPDGQNPTAENMVRVLFAVARELLEPQISVVKVRLYETPNCWADYPI